MSFLLIGVVLLALWLWGGKPGRMLKLGDWRVSSGVLSIGLLAAAAFVGVRGGELKTLILLIAGLMLALIARWPRSSPSVAAPTGMALDEARSILGVGPQASEAEIRAAYAHLIRIVHPDRGGASGLAAQLNLARDRLLKRP